MYDNEDIIGFLGVVHQPCNKNFKIKRVTRLVILPDYQGIGLGTKFLSKIAKIYVNEGYDFSIVTSAKNLIYSLRKSDKWILQRYSKNTKQTNEKESLKRTKRDKCKTASFFYKKV